jgi:hypothetical protein
MPKKQVRFFACRTHGVKRCHGSGNVKPKPNQSFKKISFFY